jgi:hypothetical protein
LDVHLNNHWEENLSPPNCKIEHSGGKDQYMKHSLMLVSCTNLELVKNEDFEWNMTILIMNNMLQLKAKNGKQLMKRQFKWWNMVLQSN